MLILHEDVLGSESEVACYGALEGGGQELFGSFVTQEGTAPSLTDTCGGGGAVANGCSVAPLAPSRRRAGASACTDDATSSNASNAAAALAAQPLASTPPFIILIRTCVKKAKLARPVEISSCLF